MENKNNQILAKQHTLLPAESELPLTGEEKEELKECEFRIQEAKELIEYAHLVIARELSKIRAKKLYRATHKTFEAYIAERFSFERTHGQLLAQIGDFLIVVGEALEIKISFNTAKELVRAINRLSKSLDLEGVELNILKPIIHNSIQLMVKLAPKTKDGLSPNLVPALVTNFYNRLNDFIQETIVEIEGQALTIAEAKEKNLINHSSREEVILQIAQQISEDSGIINLKANYESEPIKIKSETEKIITTKWRSAELLAKEYIESDENVLEVEDVSESNLGYDLEVIYKDNRKIYVEVKKVSSFNEPFELTNNEFACATNYGEDYYMALVIHNPFQINFISNPIAELESKRIVKQISWKFGDYANNLQKDL